MVPMGETLDPYFDWYQATFDCSEDDLIEISTEQAGEKCVLHQCKGVPQYDRSIGVWASNDHRDAGQAAIAVVSFGGNDGAGAHIRVTGRPADSFASALRSRFPYHRVARLDSCFDFTGVGCFDSVAICMERLFVERGIRRDRHGFPENGQTYYLGAPKSPMRVRCYEKGKQLRLHLPPFKDWVRLECQYRPRTAEKGLYASVSAHELWGSTKWTRQLLKTVANLSVEPIKQLPKLDKEMNERLAFVITQYWRTFSGSGLHRVQDALKVMERDGEEGLRQHLGLSPLE